MQIDMRGFLDELRISSGSSVRADCPSCGGKATLSVTNSFGRLLYNCYRASCGLHGAVGGQVTLQDIQVSLCEGNKEPVGFVIPSWFILQDNAYKGVPTYTDIKENRQVFLVKTLDGKIIDACGRALTKGVKPKWKRYANSRYPFIVSPSVCTDVRIGVVVEDCYSACAVAATGLYTGIALMGTSIHSGYSEWVRPFRAIICALDYDATNKALEIAQELAYTLPTTSVILKKDLKEYTSEQIVEILREARESLERECQNRLQ